MRHIGDDERRARIGARHGIAPGRRLSDPVAAARAMTVLHATEQATIYLSLAARVDDLTVDQIDAVLHDDRTLVKQLAMRRTLFAFPRELLPATWGSASARVAEQQRVRIVRDVADSDLATDADAWLASVERAVVAELTGGTSLGSRELRARVPEMEGTVITAPQSRWGGAIPIAPLVLTYLGARGILARGTNAGHWRLSRPTWTLMADWLGGEAPAPCTADDGYAELVGRWLRTFGPGTEADIAWWLGATLGIVRRALAANGAEPVTLDGGGTGWVLPDDLEPEPEPHDPWVALLPVLDPTTMGWKARDFYLGPHRPRIFDSVGNAGTTAWWNGRIVGCWVQDEDASVRVVLLDEVPAEARDALDAEAHRLTRWLDGVRVSAIYTSPAMKAAVTG